MQKIVDSKGNLNVINVDFLVMLKVIVESKCQKGNLMVKGILQNQKGQR